MMLGGCDTTMTLSKTATPSGETSSFSWTKVVDLSALPSPLVSSRMAMRSPPGRRPFLRR